jgi:hypothetical protein
MKLDYLFLDASFFRQHRLAVPSRCWRPAGSPPMASPPPSAWRRAPASPSTPGRTSSPTCATAACPPRCRSSPTGRPGRSARLSGSTRKRCVKGVLPQFHRAHLRRNPQKGQGHRPAPRRNQLPHPGVGHPGTGLPRLARLHHDRRRAAAPARPAPLPARTTPPAPATHRHHDPRRRHARNCQGNRVISPTKRNHARRFTPDSRRHPRTPACSSVRLSSGCADDRRRGVCGLRGAAAVALRGRLGGPVCARPCRAGAQGPVRRAVLPAPLNRLAGMVSAAVAPALRQPEGHASPGGRNRWPGTAATGREPSARSTAGC